MFHAAKSGIMKDPAFYPGSAIRSVDPFPKILVRPSNLGKDMKFLSFSLSLSLFSGINLRSSSIIWNEDIRLSIYLQYVLWIYDK